MGKISGKRLLFVTGTDTGVGKTVATVLLLAHLRASGRHALALKPFCSGGREDLDALTRFQAGELDDAQLAPWVFPEPLSPWAASRLKNFEIDGKAVVRHIQAIAACCDRLLVEGAGGALVPINSGYLMADLAAELRCPVLVVSVNRLGTINHTLLTLEALRGRGIDSVRVLLFDTKTSDPSAETNPELLERLCGCPLYRLPWLGADPLDTTAVQRTCKIFYKTLALVMG